MNSRKEKSHRVMNNHATNRSLGNSATNNNYEESSSSSSSDSSDDDNIETEGSYFRAPTTSFQSTPFSNTSKKLKTGKKMSENNTSDNETSSFIKRIHVSSDEGDVSARHVRKKARRYSEVDALPSFMGNLDITPKSEIGERKKACKRNQARSVEKKRLKKKRSEKPHLINNGNQESETYVSIAEPSIARKTPNFRITSIPSLSAEIVVLQHPTSVTLHKFIDVKVISGGISILGWKMTSLSKKVTIFSFERTGLIELTTLHSDPMWKTKEIYDDIKVTLKRYVKKEGTAKILEKCDNSSVILLLQRATITSSLKILSVYYPRESWFQTLWKNNRRFVKKKPSHQTMKFTADYITVAEAIAYEIRKTTLNPKLPTPRIVICGNSHTGKSTAARFIINRLLVMFPHVLYLDADPGQPEFTPPGVVSLSRVDKCMLGPPFIHPRKPLRMVFTGAVSAEASPPMYFKSVKLLLQYYLEEHSSETLFVNTMGWLQGVGILCLKDVIAMVEPTIIVELLEEGKESSVRTFLKPVNVKHYIIPAVNPEVVRSSYKGKDRRNFSILAYFGQCAMNLHLRPIKMNEMKAFCVCWDHIAIYVFGSKIMPYRIVEAINASFVALCTVNESDILKSDIAQFQTTLKTEPENICHGFGIVRAIDEALHLLHIITPLKLEELKKVNAIMKGNITVPDSVFLQQSIQDIPFPFLDQSKAAPTSSRETVRKRSYRGQIGAM